MTRIAILTTETPHHSYFVREVAQRHDIVSVISETRSAKAPFETSHPFESERDRFEIDSFFAGKRVALSELATTLVVEDANSEESVSSLRKATPDVLVVFGTGLLRKPLIDSFPGKIFNLHGGNPEEYRGLDSHLWGIYHGDFGALTTTLHHVNTQLDDGNLIGQSRLELPRGAQLYQLRSINTQACIRLTLDAVTRLERRDDLTGTPQKTRGRYYSFMPSVLKAICVDRFRKYTETLK